MQGSASNLSQMEEASTQELSNIVPHDSPEVMWKMDHFGEQRGEGSTEEATAETLPEGELAEEAMELGYQPGSEGEVDSNSTDSPHSPGHAMQYSPSNTATGAVCQGAPGIPPTKLQMRVKGRSSQCSQPPREMRMSPQRGPPSQGRSHWMQPPLEVTCLVTARRK